MALTSSSSPELFPQLLESSCGSPTFSMWSLSFAGCAEVGKLTHRYIFGVFLGQSELSQQPLSWSSLWSYVLVHSYQFLLIGVFTPGVPNPMAAEQYQSVAC